MDASLELVRACNEVSARLFKSLLQLLCVSTFRRVAGIRETSSTSSRCPSDACGVRASFFEGLRFELNIPRCRKRAHEALAECDPQLRNSIIRCDANARILCPLVLERDGRLHAVADRVELFPLHFRGHGNRRIGLRLWHRCGRRRVIHATQHRQERSRFPGALTSQLIDDKGCDLFHPRGTRRRARVRACTHDHNRRRRQCGIAAFMCLLIFELHLDEWDICLYASMCGCTIAITSLVVAFGDAVNEFLDAPRASNAATALLDIGHGHAHHVHLRFFLLITCHRYCLTRIASASRSINRSLNEGLEGFFPLHRTITMRICHRREPERRTHRRGITHAVIFPPCT